MSPYKIIINGKTYYIPEDYCASGDYGNCLVYSDNIIFEDGKLSDFLTGDELKTATAAIKKYFDDGKAKKTAERQARESERITKEKLKPAIPKPLKEYNEARQDLRKEILKNAVPSSKKCKQLEPVKKKSIPSGETESINPDAILPPSDDEAFTKPAQVRSILSQYADFRFNIITGKYQFSPKDSNKWRDLTDRDINTLRRTLIDNFLNSSLTIDILLMVIYSDFSKSYDPIKEYFGSLPAYDGNDHIAQLSLLVTVTPGQYGDGIDAQTVWYDYLKRWLVANVAMWLGKNINHTCLALLGPQGVGKTTLLRRLGPSDDLTFVGNIDPANKDSKILYAEKLLIVLDELEGTTKHDLNALKSNMTLTTITVRRPYGRTAEDLPRRAGFSASANDIHILGDMTGSRRWLCVECERIDYQSVTPELMQKVYSQAVHLLEQNFKYWFSDSEILQLEKQNARFYQACPEEECLKSKYEPADWDDVYAEQLTNTKIYQNISSDYPSVNFSQRKIGQVLKKLNYERRMRKDGLYAYSVKRK